MWTSEEVQLERKKAYAEGRADAIKEFPTHLPAIDEESRKKLNATINEAAEFIRQEAYDKGQAEGHQKGWGAGYDGAMNNAVLALAREAGDGYGPELEKSIKARDHRIHQAALVEVDRAWSWWLGATVEGRKMLSPSGSTVQSRVSHYLAQATNWAINYNTGELDNPISRATVLQEGRKTGHEAAIEFAKQVIAGTLRDTSYGIKEAVDTRVRYAEIAARDEAYVSGRAEAFTFAGAVAQAALKSGHFASTPEAHELNKALDGFLERERDYRSGFVGEAEKSKVRQATIETCWNHMVDLAEAAADGRAFPKVVGLLTSERQRVEAALRKLRAGAWPRAVQLLLAYRHGDHMRIDNNDETNFVMELRSLRLDAYIDGFEKARIRVSNLLSDAKPPERHEIKDPVSDVPF